jgi:hypothetical protein
MGEEKRISDSSLKSAACARLAVGGDANEKKGWGEENAWWKWRMKSARKEHPLFILVNIGGLELKRRGSRAGRRLIRNGNAKPERADIIPQSAAPNPSGTGIPKIEARLPSDRLLFLFKILINAEKNYGSFKLEITYLIWTIRRIRKIIDSIK